MARLIECVPNFSDGRDEAVVQALVEAVASVPEVVVLDRTLDPDHHRSVLTFAGPPEAVGEAAFRAVRVASERIDLGQHQGVHPRVGATDVVPFVPLEGTTMAECAALARAVGARIGRELQIPVFFYEQAATDPPRRRLEEIRRGGLTRLAYRMAREPSWKPDCGPARPHPTAGVTAVGARPILVAFNVNLASRDVTLAQSIARAVRASNGGLPAVKAIGVDLASRGQVQVSMNLTDIDLTPIHVALDAVRKQAQQVGVAVVQTELIGLVPQRAVLAAAQAGLQLETSLADRILETRLDCAQAGRRTWSDRTLGDLLEALGSAHPTPAGASLAAWAGAMAAQLAAKLVRIRAKRGPGGEEHDRLAKLGALSRELCRLAEADAIAYRTVLEEQRAARADPSRGPRRDEALATATEIPLGMAERLVELLALLDELPTVQGAPTTTDLEVARLVAVAGLRATCLVVGGNVNRLINQTLKRSFRERLSKVESCLEGLKGLC